MNHIAVLSFSIFLDFIFLDKLVLSYSYLSIYNIFTTVCLEDVDTTRKHAFGPSQKYQYEHGTGSSFYWYIWGGWNL